MYKHLTKGEKNKKLKQARKRAIVWSAQEHLRKALKNQSLSKTETEKPAAKSPPIGSRVASASRSPLPPTAQPPIPNQYTTVPFIAETRHYNQCSSAAAIIPSFKGRRRL